jgi:hypothetical protein
MLLRIQLSSPSPCFSGMSFEGPLTALQPTFWIWQRYCSFRNLFGWNEACYSKVAFELTFDYLYAKILRIYCYRLTWNPLCHYLH